VGACRQSQGQLSRVCSRVCSLVTSGSSLGAKRPSSRLWWVQGLVSTNGGTTLCVVGLRLVAATVPTTLCARCVGLVSTVTLTNCVSAHLGIVMTIDTTSLCDSRCQYIDDSEAYKTHSKTQWNRSINS